jgi:hypothetical protein
MNIEKKGKEELKSKLIVNLTTVIFAGIIGALLTYYFNLKQLSIENELQTKRELSAIKIEQDRIRFNENLSATFFITNLIYERYTRAMMLNSGIIRYCSNPSQETKEELITRKALYDRSLEKWNIELKSNILKIRLIHKVGLNLHSDLENEIQFNLGSDLRKIDKILTENYDKALNSSVYHKQLSQNHLENDLKILIDKSYLISEKLVKDLE